MLVLSKYTKYIPNVSPTDLLCPDFVSFLATDLARVFVEGNEVLGLLGAVEVVVVEIGINCKVLCSVVGVSFLGGVASVEEGESGEGGILIVK